MNVKGKKKNRTWPVKGSQKPMKRLSKSKLARGLQCPKSLYLTIHHPELEEDAGEEQKYLLDQGNLVDQKAQEYFPGGVREKAHPSGKGPANPKASAIFQSTIIFENFICRVDVLERAEKWMWNLIEVKSSTSVKREHIMDVAIQAYIASLARTDIKDFFLMYINSDCEYPNLKNLFTRTKVTENVLEKLPEIKDIINKLVRMLEEKAAPEIDIGPHCHSPYECPFIKHCWKHVPKTNSFQDLPGRTWKFYEEGLLSIKDIPQNHRGLSDLQKRAIICVQTGKRFVDRKKIKSMLKKLHYPLHFFDFETFNPAIPRLTKSTPYQPIPFQFSLHIQNSAQAKVQHFEYLHTSASDPRVEIIEAMLASFKKKGSILCYNANFEKKVLMELAHDFPQYKKELTQLTSRLFDLLPVIQEGIYDEQFRGSFSLKSVAPALLGSKMSYELLDIQSGDEASKIFAELIAPTTAEARQKQIATQLRKYCKKDTQMLVSLFKFLKRL